MTFVLCILYGIIIWLMLEMLVWILLQNLRKDFQWLIMPEDIFPDIDPEKIHRHAEQSFDSDLGWCRRAGDEWVEETDGESVSCRIGHSGERYNPSFSELPESISVYGDSYAFCRQVDDNETWPHYLSVALGVNIGNYGVGNYGMDQALLRLERDLPNLKSETVIMAVVPETIARVHSYWKHYFEYGNLLAFKPRFTFDGECLDLHAPAIRNIDEYTTYKEKISDIQSLDPFYRDKFLPDVLRFPFVLGLLRRWRRHFPIIWYLLCGRFMGNRMQGWRRAFGVVLRDNARWTDRLYRTEDAQALLGAIVERFADICRKSGKNPVLMFLPQPMDIERSDRATAHAGFVKNMEHILPVFDSTVHFTCRSDWRSLFIGGRLGPHTSSDGNIVISESLAVFLKEKNLLNSRVNANSLKSGK